MRAATLFRLLVVSALVAVACTADAGPRERIVGGPCEGCEWVFAGRPARPGWDARIAPAGEPGEPLVIDGTVRDAAGAPAAGIIVYAYHTDAKGLYPPDPRHPRVRHGRLRGFARTDARGRFRFTTIRPASYPASDAPQHVHLHVLEPGRCTYYLDDLVFTDDPNLTPAMRRQVARGRGGSGVATPTRDDAGTWRVRRDIVLGAGIPDHARCR